MHDSNTGRLAVAALRTAKLESVAWSSCLVFVCSLTRFSCTRHRWSAGLGIDLGADRAGRLCVQFW